MPLSEKQLKHRCLANCGHMQCRYLKFVGWKTNECIKLLPSRKKTADKIVREHLLNCKKSGIQPSNHTRPIGDGGNCPGYRYLPTILQGFDVKK